MDQLKDTNDVLEIIANQLLGESFEMTLGDDRELYVVMLPEAQNFVRFVETINAYSGAFADNRLYEQVIMVSNNSPMRKWCVEQEIYDNDAAVLLDYLVKSFTHEFIDMNAHICDIGFEILKYLNEHENPLVQQKLKSVMNLNAAIHGNLNNMFAAFKTEDGITNAFDYVVQHKLQSATTLICDLMGFKNVGSDTIIRLIIAHGICYTNYIGDYILDIKENFGIRRLCLVRYFIANDFRVFAHMLKRGFTDVYGYRTTNRIARMYGITPIRDITGEYRYIPKKDLLKIKI
jgi:hypothetical protein